MKSNITGDYSREAGKLGGKLTENVVYGLGKSILMSWYTGTFTYKAIKYGSRKIDRLYQVMNKNRDKKPITEDYVMVEMADILHTA